MTRAVPKPTPPKKQRASDNPRARAFMDFVASQGCLLCDKPAELHHVRGVPSSKTGLPLRKRQHLAQYAVVPLCRHHHREGRNAIEAIGEEAFGVNYLGGSNAVMGHALRLALRYINERGPT